VLLLGNNALEDEGARELKAAVSDNTTLEVLDLSWNNFKRRGAALLVEAVQVGAFCFQQVTLPSDNISPISLVL